MTAFPNRPVASVEEYLELDRNSIEKRYEYIDGTITMLAGGTLDHATIGANIHSALRDLLRGSSCRVYSSDARVRISERRYVYPDVTVTCNDQDRGQIDTISSPRVVVEVLSPGTEAYDRGKKSVSYRECPSIQEYLLVDTQSPLVEVFRREKNGLWVLSTLRLDDEIQLASLGVHFPVKAVYEDILFSTDDNQPA